MINPLRHIFQEFQAAFAPPDPMRFAVHSSPPPNWFGELERKVDRTTSGPVLVNQQTNTYEFDRARVDVLPDLTDLDKKGLRARGLNPDGDFKPAYEAAKRYFSKQPFCKKEALAANSVTDEHPGFTIHTAKDVLAAFNAFLVDKPSF